MIDLIKLQNNLTWSNSNTPEVSLDSGMRYSKLLKGVEKNYIYLVPVLKTSHWYRLHPFYLSISPVLWHKCQRVFSSCYTWARHGWEIWLSRLDLSGTPGLRPIGLSPGSWQTSLGMGPMSRYSAQILICITKYFFQENVFENTAYQMAAIMFSPQCDLPLMPAVYTYPGGYTRTWIHRHFLRVCVSSVYIRIL